MGKLYFVILNHPNGSVLPLVEENEDLAMFESETEAIIAGRGSFLGDTFGWEVFKLGQGV